MKSITKEAVQKFISENKFELSCTQKKLSVPIINRIYKKMLVGIRFMEIKVEDGLICDGHHRYLAARMAEYSLETIPSTKTSATIIIDWGSIHLDENDWDSPETIEVLNKQDAGYNNLPIEKLVELLE